MENEIIPIYFVLSKPYLGNTIEIVEYLHFWKK